MKIIDINIKELTAIFNSDLIKAASMVPTVKDLTLAMVAWDRKIYEEKAEKITKSINEAPERDLPLMLGLHPKIDEGIEERLLGHLVKYRYHFSPSFHIQETIGMAIHNPGALSRINICN